MKKIVGSFMCALVLVFMLSVVQAQEKTETLNILYIAQSGYHPDILPMLRRMFTELTGIEINIEYVKYEDLYEKVIESASTYDVISLDQIWLADFVSKGLLASLDNDISKRMQKDITPAVMKAFQYQNQTWAFPFLVNFQMFFYNNQMIQDAGFKTPPQSLEAMVEQMNVMKKKGVVEYPWTDSWDQSEGLISEYVWLTGAFGGKLFDEDGNPIFDQEPGVKALQFMFMLIEEQLADPSILTNDEIAAKDVFISGKAAFSSNWVFMSGLLNDPATSEITGQGKIGLLPASKEATVKTVSVGGFQGIAITAASQKKETAWKWIKFLTSPLVQRAFLFEMPIWIPVQTSQDVNILDPMMVIKRQQLENVYCRPNIPNYSTISPILQKYIHLALEGKAEPVAALTQAKTEIISLIKESAPQKENEQKTK
jgi:multiple sugar transport system substrate-binding protein